RSAISPASLSLYCSPSLLALHSFPTRRSSDLARSTSCRSTARRGAWPAGCTHCWPNRPIVCRHLQTSIGTWPWNGCGNVPGPSRSEEHTSELQSRFDLVCRLLLEKKKKK